MRRVVWIALPALLLGVALFLMACEGNQDTPEPPPQQNRTQQPPAIEWTSLTADRRLKGFTIDYPKGWRVQEITNGWGLQFIAPESGDFRPNFHVYWGTRGKEIDDWVRDGERKYLQRGPGSSTALERKRDITVAGMPARLLIHTRDGEEGRITWMSWFFADPDLGHGELKGVCTSSQLSLLGYRRIFEEFARRIRYRRP